MAGLREDLRAQVKLSKPLTMVAAYRNVSARETITTAKRKVSRPPLSKNFCNLHESECWVWNKTTQGKGIESTTNPTIKRLTPEQVNDYRKKGLCFKCDDKFLPGHKCSLKKLMMVEIDYPKDEAEEILFEPKGELREMQRFQFMQWRVILPLRLLD